MRTAVGAVLAALGALAVWAPGASADEVLLASDSGSGGATIIVSEDIWWPAEFRMAYEGYKPAEGGQTRR